MCRRTSGDAGPRETWQYSGVLWPLSPWVTIAGVRRFPWGFIAGGLALLWVVIAGVVELCDGNEIVISKPAGESK